MKSLDVIDYWMSGRWRTKPKARGMIHATGLQLEEMSNFYDKLTYNIDKGEGYVLDVIGAILGLPRLQIPANLQFFGFEGTPLAVGFDVAPFYDYDNPGELVPVPDAVYKKALHFKVFMNTTDGTRSSVIRATKALLEVEDVELVDNEDMQYKIIVHEPLDDLTLYVLNLYRLYIKPGGVKFLGYQTEAKNLIGII
ncbi:TPA: DUF2612 domain-containing protein [Vibrio harveyi]|nr:DUF2612 domain-containing protein [Vibrio harveyi]HEQ3599257.1 DUF2612 domain-containing protein [Vibrio harveyi]HEQ3611315.1 DUF2612 domain-containing protein [Vibrio harveyi]